LEATWLVELQSLLGGPSTFGMDVPATGEGPLEEPLELFARAPVDNSGAPLYSLN